MVKRIQKKIPSSASKLDLQLKQQRRTVDFDTFDIHIQQLMTMIEEKAISIAPAYQRLFRWDNKRCSQFIESLLLGIPVPSIFMATNADNTWEAVDGVQRLSAIVKFMGDNSLRNLLSVGDTLTLSELQKLTIFDGLQFDDLPSNIQLHFKTRPLKVVTLNDKSDNVVRYDLFERLNTGGVILSEQEIRSCVYRGKFADRLEVMANSKEFRQTVKLTDQQQKDATAEECVLRFFAYYDNYKNFDHSVKDFLTDYMAVSAKKFDYSKKEKLFFHTFGELAKIFPKGISRPSQSRTTTPLNLFEGIAVGAALALEQTGTLKVKNVISWVGSEKLRHYTAGATNNRPAVKGRIEFCRDRFLGK